jgi:hypothetical protein
LLKTSHQTFQFVVQRDTRLNIHLRSEDLVRIVLRGVTGPYLAQVADLREFAQAIEAGEGTAHLEDVLRHREIRRADLYRLFEQAAFSPAPIPLVAPNELDLPEDN